MILFQFLLCLVFIGILVYGIFRAVTFLFSLSIVFSKITISLFVAVIFHSAFPILSNATVSYIIWTAICLGVCFLICQLPRVDCALEFFCTTLVTYVIVQVISSFVINSLLKLDLSDWGAIGVEIAIKLGVAFFSITTLLEKFNETNIRKFSNFLIVNIDRLIASVLYGFMCTALTFGNLPVVFSDAVILAVLVGSVIIMFIVDCIFISRK